MRYTNVDAYTYVFRRTFVPSELKMAHIEPKERHEYHKEDFAFVSLLKDCAKKKDIYEGTKLHADILKKGLLKRCPHLTGALITLYSKCGALIEAEHVLDGFPIRNVVTWNILISGYVQHNHGHEAMTCFERMQNEGQLPDVLTYICIVKACGSMKSIEKGQRIHDEIVIRGLLKKEIVLGTALVDMYAKCGVLAKARQVHQELLAHDVISWNALITGYAQQGQSHEALECFEQMQSEGLSPNAVTFICVLKACGGTQDLDKGKTIHDEIVSRGMLVDNIMLGTALVDMYAKCGELAKARRVLEELPMRNVISWSALIAGYAEQGQYEEVLSCFEHMQSEGISPNAVTFICMLKVCSKTKNIDKGRQIHCDIVCRGFLGKDLALGNALVDMYVQQGHGHEALKCFKLMQSEGISPDAVTFTCILKACGNIGAIEKGKYFHHEVICKGFLEKDVVLGTALVDMYAKGGELEKAQEVHENLPLRNVVSSNALISGYAQWGQGDKALNCFEWMQREGFSPDAITFICTLKACGSTGAIDKGKQIHDNIVNLGLLEKEIMLGTALVDMYAKCNLLAKAQQVLEELPERNVASWNALIGGYSQERQGQEALCCFKRMQSEGISPNAITFLSVLSACSHSGLLDEAQMLFGNMTRKYDMIPELEHHTCIVAVLGCAGHFDKAMSAIEVMPHSGSPAVWLSLLGACRKWGNLKLGILAFDQSLQLDHTCATAYILMANIFAAAGMQEDAENVETMRMKYAPSND